MQYKNINKRDYISKHQIRWQPKNNHYIPNDYPPPFVIGQMFKTTIWEKTYIFTITDISKISQYKTFVYSVDMETWEEEVEDNIWQGHVHASMQALNNMSGANTIATVSPTLAQTGSHLIQVQKNMTAYYYLSSTSSEPKHIHNMKSNGTIAHNALISMSKEEMTESDYAIFLLNGELVIAEEEE